MGDVRPLDLTDELREQLAAVPLLATIDQEAFETGLEQCPVLSVPPAVRIVVEGEYDDRFYVLVKGRCDVSKEQGGVTGTVTNLAGDGNRERARTSTTLISLVGGDFFGEMSCMSPWPRSSTVTTTAASTVLEIDNDVFDEWMKASDGFREIMESAYMSRGLKSLLRGLDAFAMLGDDSLEEMIEGATMASYKKDRPIVTEGGVGDAFYVIRGGVVSVEKETEDGSHIVSYLRAGNYFGEMALLDGTSRTATVRATNNTEVIVIARDKFLSVVNKHPQAAQHLRDTVKARLQAEAALLGDEGTADALSFMAGQGILAGTDLLVVDLQKCIYCGNCEEACANSHKVSLITLHGPNYKENLFPTACRNCDDPLCLLKCPVDAIQRDRSGEVKIYDHCIGCSGCAVNCPYDTIAMTPISEHKGEEIRARGGFKKPITRQAIKCDLCEDISGGPQCVASCPTAAILRFKPKALVHHILKKGSK